MKLVVPDLISPSYFPAIAAVELGCIAQRGVDMKLELHFPVTDAIDALRTGEVDVVAGAAHALFHGALDGGGVRLLAAISHNTYWFLVVRSEFGSITLADPSGLRVGVAPDPDEAFVQMLVDAGVDPMTVDIGPIPGSANGGISFGIAAAAQRVQSGIPSRASCPQPGSWRSAQTISPRWSASWSRRSADCERTQNERERWPRDSFHRRRRISRRCSSVETLHSTMPQSARTNRKPSEVCAESRKDDANSWTGRPRLWPISKCMGGWVVLRARDQPSHSATFNE